jgi:phosphoribosylformimino-5-aminoimidazole carboxamide ribotide isomerase
MIAIPAVDLRDGACVQLVGGSYADERIRLDDPAAVACRWEQLGFRRLHVVDLDAATGRGENEGVVERILSRSGAAVQVGGGIRFASQVQRLLCKGARYVVVGTRAVENPAWLHDLAFHHPGSVIVAADVRERNVVTHGWDHVLPTDILALVDQLAALPLAGVLVTAVHVEGRMAGPDLDLVDDIVKRTRHPLIASGGVGTLDDLRALERRNVAGAVIGMALYTGALDARAVAEEFAE